MGRNSGIEWTEHTWNPWRGCRKVSQGCKNCYMFREQSRYGRDPKEIVRARKTTFNAPLSWKEPAMVFTCSWSDWFIEDADEWRGDAWDIVRNTPHLIYQILTKRPENIIDRLPDDWGNGYPNVWLGVSAENQETAVKRVPLLFEIPAAVRWVSAEPLLGPIDFEVSHSQGIGEWLIDYLDWIVVGGESGPGHREMKEWWASGILEQCRQAGVAYFFKQMGGWPDKRGNLADIPASLQVREFPYQPEGK